MDKLTSALQEQGIAPADTCAVSGADRPDSLCLVVVDGTPCFQPVSSVALRQRIDETREKIENNRANGSYALGFIGALLGMLAGVLLNALGIVFTERIYALLFALVPIAAMFGYKLFRGKMSRAAVAIVIVLSLLGIPLIPLFEVVYLLMHEYSLPLGGALGAAAAMMVDPEFLSEITGELLQLLLFMALGILISLRYMTGVTNNSRDADTEAQMASLRPNPRYNRYGETV
ncbi:MAG: hypothetical protein IKQ10_11485 [Oscillospiraceae bacterium]|nr:hypothetical protein [Oscillospiraceae bacterium]